MWTYVVTVIEFQFKNNMEYLHQATANNCSAPESWLLSYSRKWAELSSSIDREGWVHAVRFFSENELLLSSSQRFVETEDHLDVWLTCIIIQRGIRNQLDVT